MPDRPVPRVISAVVFDVGETLVNETRAWGEVARAAGIPELTLFAALGALIERGEDHRRVWQMLGVPVPTLTPSIERSDLYPDAIATLECLRGAGCMLGIAGNQPPRAESALEELGLPVDFIASSSSWGVSKPSCGFFARIVETVGRPASEIAHVGDRLDNDVLPAAEIGMFSIFVVRGPWGHVHRSRPEAAGADLIVSDLHEIPRALGADR